MTRRAPVAALAAGVVFTLGVTVSACAPATPDVALIPFDETSATAASEPGLALGFGDAAWLPAASELGDVAAVSDLAGVTVLDVLAGNPDEWPRLVANPADFAGETPVSIVVQTFGAPVSADAADGPWPYLVPVAANGQPGSIVVDADGDPVACGLRLPEVADGGSDAVRCFVAIGPEGAALTAVRFFGITPATPFQPTPDENPYYSAPVTWGIASPTSLDAPQAP